MGMALYNGKMYVITDNGYLVMFGSKPNITVSQTYNNTALDRDSVSATTADATQLTVSLSNNATGATIDFYGKLTEPSYFAGDYYIGSNNSASGVATYLWNSDNTFPAGQYVWRGTNANYNTLNNATLRVYGGMNTSFRYAGRDTNSSYNGTDNATVSAFAGFMGDESTETMKDVYNLKYNATFVKPLGEKVSFGLANQTDADTPTIYLANSTVYSCYKVGGGHYIDFSDDLEPTPIPNGIFLGSGYYLRWTCNSTTCPSYYNKEYEIMDSWDQGSWWGNNFDYLGLQGWTGCTGAPGTNANGWSFTVFTNNTVITKHWNGTSSLTNDSGAWTAYLNATADWFFTNDTTNRTFNVTVPSNGTTNQTNVTTGGEEAPLPIVYKPGRTLEMTFNGESFEKEGMDYVSVGRGSTGDLVLDLKNTGSTSLYGLDISATGAAAGWVSFQWTKVDLDYKAEKRMLVTVDVPAGTAPGEYEVTVGVSNEYVKYSKKFIIEISAKCPVCAAAGEWSECADGKRSRSVSSCGSETEYACKQITAEEVCAKPADFWTWIADAWFSFLRALGL